MPKRKHKDGANDSFDDAAESDLNLSTVKCALRKRCKNQILFDRINDDVREMSALAVEASRYFHFIQMRNFRDGEFPQEPIDFAHYFYSLLDKNIDNSEHRALDPEYRALRPNIPFYNNSFRSNVMTDLVTQYRTVFKNNLKMHAYSRMRKFFKSLVITEDDEVVEIEYSDIRNTLNYLFIEESDAQPEQYLLDAMVEHLQWDGRRLFDIDTERYYRHIKLFYMLQRYNEANNFKNFKLIPQYSHGSLHIRYDTQAMFTVLTHLKLFQPENVPRKMKKKKNGLRDYVQQNDVERKRMWFSHFKIPQTKNKTFGFSLQTDGVAVSFCMHKKAPKTELFTDDQVIGDLDKIRRKMRNNEYDAKIGLDPGYKLMVGGTKEITVNDNMTVLKDVKISSARYHNQSAYPSRKKMLERYTTPEHTETSSMSQDFYAYIRYQLSIFERKQQQFSQRRVVRLKLKKFICVQRTCLKVAKEIISETKNALVVIGSTKFSANSPIKGYRRTPSPKLVRELRKLADVIEVDEFRTTKLCANCHQINITSRSPHRYQFCPNCHTHWHRDINAGVNILYKAKCIINQTPVHTNYDRGTKLN